MEGNIKSDNLTVSQEEYERADMEANYGESLVKKRQKKATPYTWKPYETFLLIRCYKKEGVHLLDQKPDISAALQRCVKNFNAILFKKKCHTISFKKCSTKIDTLKRIYREKLDLKKHKPGGGQSITWPYFKVLHELFHKECDSKPLSVARRRLPANLDTKVAAPRSKKPKLLHQILDEMLVDRRLKQESDALKHNEMMSRLDRFNDCMESMAQSFSVIAATMKAKLDRDNC